MITIHGKGSHGRVIFDAILARDPTAHIKWTDGSEGTHPKDTDDFIVGIGDNFIRQSLGGITTVVHPAACISQTAELGRGVYIGALANIGPKAKIGNGAIINTGAIIEHECIIGEFAHIASAAVLSGGVRVGGCTLIGANATVMLWLQVGSNAIVGAGSVVTKNIPDGEIWYGVPARHMGETRAGVSLGVS